MGQSCGKSGDVVDGKAPSKENRGKGGKKQKRSALEDTENDHKAPKKTEKEAEGYGQHVTAPKAHIHSHSNSHGHDSDNGFKFVGQIESLQHQMTPTVAVVSGDHLHSEFRQFSAAFPVGAACLSVVSCRAANMARHVLAGGENRSVALINYETGHVLRRWVNAHDGDVNRITRPLPDGTFATAGRDRAVKVWSLHGEGPVAELRGHALNVSAVDVHPDGELVVSGSKDNTVRLWDVAQQMELYCGDVKLNIVHFVRFMPALSCVAQGGEDRTLRLWDVRGAGAGMTLELSNTFEGMDYYPVSADAPADRGHTLLTGHNGVNGHGSYISEWDLRVGKCVHTYTGHAGTVSSVVAEPAGCFFSASDDGSIASWRLEDAEGDETVVMAKSRNFRVLEGRITGMDHDDGDLITSLSNGCLIVFRPQQNGGLPSDRYRYIGVMQNSN